METRKYFDYAIIKFPTFQNLGEAAKAKCRGICSFHMPTGEKFLEARKPMT